MLKVGTTLSARPVLLAIAALQPLQSPVEKAMAGTLSCRSSPIPRTTDQYRWTRLSWFQHLYCMHPMCRKTQACRQTKNCQEWPLFGCKEFLQCTDVPALSSAVPHPCAPSPVPGPIRVHCTGGAWKEPSGAQVMVWPAKSRSFSEAQFRPI